MSRKENIADYETSLKNSFERWDHLNKYGGSDPTYSDGVNMKSCAEPYYVLQRKN